MVLCVCLPSEIEKSLRDQKMQNLNVIFPVNYGCWSSAAESYLLCRFAAIDPLVLGRT
jgi:hypothetical protein